LVHVESLIVVKANGTSLVVVLVELVGEELSVLWVVLVELVVSWYLELVVGAGAVVVGSSWGGVGVEVAGVAVVVAVGTEVGGAEGVLVVTIDVVDVEVVGPSSVVLDGVAVAVTTVVVAMVVASWLGPLSWVAVVAWGVVGDIAVVLVEVGNLLVVEGGDTCMLGSSVELVAGAVEGLREGSFATELWAISDSVNGCTMDDRNRGLVVGCHPLHRVGFCYIHICSLLYKGSSDDLILSAHQGGHNT